ncbi:MAG: transcription antitermination factor NusB [Rhizobiales bacterium]|nr:transcription antitermination factor NusB [Hyphomicrobiales bacterium]
MITENAKQTTDRSASRPANKRGVARLAAVQALYQMELGGATLPQVVAEYEASRLGQLIDGEQYLDADVAYFRGIMSGVVAGQREIDPEIHGALTPDWPLSRLDVTVRAILRCGVYELRARKDVPARVILSEYVDIAKAFYDIDEPRLVNGVLDHIARLYRKDEVDGK